MDDNDDVNLPAFGKPAKIEAPPTQMLPSDKSMLNDSLDSMQNATPLKLEVSASEDEAGGGDASSASEKSKVSKKLNLSSPSSSVSNDKTPPSSNHRSNHHRTSSNDKSSSSFSSSFKRATKIPRRNSSDDFVLGFDEVSGEVELLKQKSKSKSSTSNKSNANSPEEREPWSSPSAAKRMKQSITPPTSISPARSSSTKNETKTSPNSTSKDHSSNHKKDKTTTSAENDQEHKQHIVGDSEEHSSTKAVDYGKPFALGWKRELVWRVKSSGKDTADIYFISPAGKKLRSRNEILPHLKGELRIEDFSFAKEPLGVGPEFELVRHAKGLARSTSSSNPVQPVTSPNTPTMGKRVSKPKVPKGASPPPEGWTPTRALKMNNTALSSNSSKHSSSVSSATPHTNSANKRDSSSSSSSNKNKKARKFSQELQAHSKPPKSTQSHTNNDEKPSKARKESESDSAHTTAKETPSNDKSSKSSSTSTTSQNATKATSGAAATATNVDIKYPQTIAVVKGKKYVMVSKAVATSTTGDSTDSIQSDLKQIKEGIRNIKKQSAHLQNDSLLQPLIANNSSKQFAANFFGNISSGYSALICILKYLKIHERSRSAVVCKLWNLASKDTSFWETVRMKNSKVGDWAGFASALRRGETKHLDLRKMLVPSSRSDDMWLKFCEQIGTVCTLEMIDMCRCSSQVVESLFQTNKNLRVFNALAINDNSIDLQHIEQLKNLQALRLRPCDSAKLKSGLKPLQSLKKLKHLSITGIRNLGAQDIDIIAELTGLQSLELGECGQFDATFATKVLPQLKQLQRLRLENNQSCCTLEILDAITNMPELIQLELVNFDIKPGFDVKLTNCVHIQKLLIIPTYISQSATTNNIVLSAVQKVAKTLKVFTWGVTVELLRVTALYVDQCEGSTKKEKQHFDECIPVLKPVPGSLAIEDDTNEENDDMKMDVDANSEHDGSDVPQIEIIPLDKVEMILANNLPQTKFTIVKIPYHATCKQQLVD